MLKIYSLLIFILLNVFSLQANSSSYYKMTDNTMSINIKKQVDDLLSGYIKFDFDSLYNSFYSPFGFNTGLINRILVPRIKKCSRNLETYNYLQKSINHTLISKPETNSNIKRFMNFNLKNFKKEYEYSLFVCNSTFDISEFKIRKIRVAINKQTKYKVFSTIYINEKLLGDIVYEKIIHNLYLASDDNSNLGTILEKFVNNIEDSN